MVQHTAGTLSVDLDERGETSLKRTPNAWRLDVHCNKLCLRVVYARQSGAQSKRREEQQQGAKEGQKQRDDRNFESEKHNNNSVVSHSSSEYQSRMVSARHERQ